MPLKITPKTFGAAFSAARKQMAKKPLSTLKGARKDSPPKPKKRKTEK
jgi:hypothetical protein